MRHISRIAKDILIDWDNKVSPYAKPYLEAALSLETKLDCYYQDSAETIVLYALSNMGGYRTPRAKALKQELKECIL